MSGRSSRHFDYFEGLDEMLAQQDAENERIHELVETNGTEMTEEDLAWQSFNKVFNKD